MVLGIMSLLTDLERNVQVIPYYHEGTGVGNLPRLLEAFKSKLFQFADDLGVRERDLSMIQHVKGRTRAARKKKHAHCCLELGSMVVT